MINTPMVFQVEGVLPAAGYLQGVGIWPVAVQLGGFQVLLPSGFPGSVTFALEVNGTLTGYQITLNAPVTNGLATAEPVLNVVVPANQTVRWVVWYNGTDYTQAPADVQLLMFYAGVAAVIAPVMEVRWVSGGQTTTFYSYDPNAATYADVSAGASVGRGVIKTSGGFLLSLTGPSIVKAWGGTFYATGIIVGGWPDPTADALQFVVNGLPWLTVTPLGIYTGDLNEITPLPTAAYGYYFQLLDNTGTLTAIVTADGVFALNVVEGMPP